MTSPIISLVSNSFLTESQNSSFITLPWASIWLMVPLQFHQLRLFNQQNHLHCSLPSFRQLSRKYRQIPGQDQVPQFLTVLCDLGLMLITCFSKCVFVLLLCLIAHGYSHVKKSGWIGKERRGGYP